MVVAAPIRNPWIVANRYRGKARLLGPDGAVLSFPPTNQLVVGQKTVAGQGARLSLAESTEVHRPSFLYLQTWSGSDGSTYDLVERPGRTLDLLPWCRRDGQVLVLARQGFPRPVVVADAARPNLTGAQWSGYLTEPVAAIIDQDEELPVAVRRILHERAGIAASLIRSVGQPMRYATSPGGIDEMVTAVQVELDARAAQLPSGGIHALDARACLRAGQVGGLFDARLELNIHHLLRRLGIAPGPWIGAAVALREHHGTWPRKAAALRPTQRVSFTPIDQPAGYLSIRRGRFTESDVAGRSLGSTYREWVQPRSASSNTAVVLPMVTVAGEVLVGIEHRWLPAIQSACGTPGLAVVPAWRLPKHITQLDQAVTWLTEQVRHDHGVVVAELVELGGPYLATPGATPELVHPWLAVIDPAQGPGQLHWTTLQACLESELLDAHLAIAVHRAAQAIG
jgi:hypothetical protein